MSRRLGGPFCYKVPLSNTLPALAALLQVHATLLIGTAAAPYPIPGIAVTLRFGLRQGRSAHACLSSASMCPGVLLCGPRM